MAFAPSTVLEQRREQMFPQLMPAQALPICYLDR